MRFFAALYRKGCMPIRFGNLDDVKSETLLENVQIFISMIRNTNNYLKYEIDQVTAV